ncbi:hypothetical protein BV25DRAFT_1832568 [Artomyces pyxidatus]|uniref:Uncharacterized protein n=1 Tax=Artomyces pyxidatus TaxID=48021 RepID=A0ACB8SI53_9AGAM|nr:hypothetical protein BV25DRAFT_1832568 [Artomyces pyxidatus]
MPSTDSKGAISESTTASPIIRTPPGSLLPPLTTSHLPYEIMTAIFEALIHLDPTGHDTVVTRIPFPSEPRDTTSPNLGWIRVTHVCKLWRHIALSYSYLWRYISFSLGEEWTAHMFARSKSAPISVNSVVSYSFCKLTPRARDLVILHIPHTSRLSLNGADTTTREIVNALNFPAPLLNRLEITFPSGAEYMQASTSDPLPPNFLGGDAPLLRHLALHYDANPWTSPILTNLVSLDLRSQDEVPTDTPPSLEEVLDALGRMKNLERLTLAHVLPLNKPIPLHITVTLPYLHSLNLQGGAAECDGLVQRLQFPDSARVTIVMGYAVGDTQADFMSFLPIAAAAMCLRREQDDPTPRPIMLLESNGYNAVALKVSRDHHSFQHLPDIDFKIFCWSFIGPQNAATPLARMACDTFILESLQELTISFGGPQLADVCAALWQSISRRAPRLWHVVTGGLLGVELCAALGTEPASFMPALSCLELTNTGFDVQRLDSRSGQTFDLNDALPRWLEARSITHIPLEILCLRGCRESIECAARLEEVVDLLDDGGSDE